MKTTSLDESKQREICAILSLGGTRQMAAHYVGCSARTIRNVAKRDPQFAERLLKTELSPEIAFLRNISNAAMEGKYWRAAAWALERMFPERYERRRPDTIPMAQLHDVVDHLVEKAMQHAPDARDPQALRQLLAKVAHETLTTPSTKKLPYAK
ncbi:MAG TPA: hypothetical protein VFE46_04090 [Pirellulales bacterium]|jgi:hypothetical protein|nr:hypothetical protein [Pirellulales bacterium]